MDYFLILPLLFSSSVCYIICCRRLFLISVALLDLSSSCLNSTDTLTFCILEICKVSSVCESNAMLPKAGTILWVNPFILLTIFASLLRVICLKFFFRKIGGETLPCWSSLLNLLRQLEHTPSFSLGFLARGYTVWVLICTKLSVISFLKFFRPDVWIWKGLKLTKWMLRI